VYVLSQVPDPNIVVERLTSRDLFDNHEVRHEYTLLLRQQFANLPIDALRQIVSFIEAGPTWNHSALDADQWRLAQLARFGDALPQNLRASYDALVETFGQPMDDTSLFVEWSGSKAPADAAALLAMADDDLVRMLATWTPGTEWSGPSRKACAESLRRPSSSIQPDSPLLRHGLLSSIPSTD
jgi:hypothetical protein